MIDAPFIALNKHASFVSSLDAVQFPAQSEEANDFEDTEETYYLHKFAFNSKLSCK